MTSIIKYTITISIFAALLLFLETSVTQNANASFCPPGTNIQICNFGQYKLRTGNWNLYVDGTDGFLNITTVKFDGSVFGTLKLGNTSGIGLCFMSHPCNINGVFNSYTGKLSFISYPTVRPIIANNQNYTGYISFQTNGIDVIKYKIDGIGTTMKPQPLREFGWDASKSCMVMGCIG
jgi:hypothetical protein